MPVYLFCELACKPVRWEENCGNNRLKSQESMNDRTNGKSQAHHKQPMNDESNRLFEVKPSLIRATLVCLMVALSAGPSLLADDPYKVVYSFTGISADGANPMGSLTLDGSTLIGMTSAGGTSSNGTIFSYSTGGTGYQTIYSFGGGTAGNQPHHGFPTVSGNTIYGMTLFGGSGNGNVFSIGTDGSSYTNLYSFSGTSTDGQQPHGVELAKSGSTLYGMTSGMNGAASATDGTLFSYNTANGSFTTLVSFTGSSGSYPGSQPHTGLLRSGTTLYGMTYLGGNGTDNGTLFSYDTTNSTFKNLVSFTGTSGSYIGANPAGDLIQGPDNLLYGVTSAGGTNGNGTVFSYDTADGSFTTLFSFNGTNGATPWGQLTLTGTTLFGTTAQGGSSNKGTLFSIHTDGSGFESLLSFTGTNGAVPMGSLTLDGTSLYGTTYAGGNNNDGVLFSYEVPETSSLALAAIGAVVLLLKGVRGRPGGCHRRGPRPPL